MSKFEIGDEVQMPGVPMVVEVEEIATCDEGVDGAPCDLGGEIFRFADPVSGLSDWMHSSEFEKV